MHTLLSGKDVATDLLPSLQARALALKEKGITPTLATIRLGSRISDVRYEKSAQKRCEKAGIAFQPFVLPEGSSQNELLQTIRKVNQDLSIHGCLIFRPFPPDFDDALIRAALSPEKDVDGITDVSLAGLFTGVEDDAEAVFIEAHDLGDFLDGIEHLASDGSIIRCQVGNALDMLLRDDQDMDRSDRVDVFKGEEIIVFPNFGARDFPGNDLAENAVFHDKFLLCCVRARHVRTPTRFV